MAQLYDEIGIGYGDRRRPEPRIARAIHAALGDARTLVNVGAGTGSYEPRDFRVVAVEPSLEMIGQRPRGAAPVVRASAERLPFSDASFDAALAILTLHHWPDQPGGLAELVRVARSRVVILSFISEGSAFWLYDYFPEIPEIDAVSCPGEAELGRALGPLECAPLLIPHDCIDGFLGAYWRRPRAYLDPDVRRAISAFSRIERVDEGLERLRADLDDGRWANRYGSLMDRTELDLGYRVIVAELPKT